MSPRPANEIRRALDEGEWLGVVEVAEVLGVHRQTVHRMLAGDHPVIRYREKAGRGGYRRLNPEDVLRELAKSDAVHGEPDESE